MCKKIRVLLLSLNLSCMNVWCLYDLNMGQQPHQQSIVVVEVGPEVQYKQIMDSRQGFWTFILGYNAPIGPSRGKTLTKIYFMNIKYISCCSIISVFFDWFVSITILVYAINRSLCDESGVANVIQKSNKQNKINVNHPPLLLLKFQNG